MTLGERLKQLRLERSLTQPEMAVAVGIEQSYLSKLENGKSLPSNDILQRILDVLDLGVDELVEGLDQGVRNQMRAIPLVGDYLDRQKRMIIGNRRRWLLVSGFLASVGIALIYAGHQNLCFPSVEYQYLSHGVVLDGESKELFRNPHASLPEKFRGQEVDEFMDAIQDRVAEDFVRTTEYRGTVYNVPVAGGSRTYYLEARTEIDSWLNKLVVFIGVLSLAFGLFGVVLEKKLSYA